MSKIYFSRSISRTLSADHPVGDPTGGVAYGEKNDPVSAIFSLATMGGTYAAATGVGMGIGATFSAMTVMQGITFAGAALSLVGNVTGSKTLSKIGMIAGIAGGIGSLAESAGIISKTPTLGETFGSTGASSGAVTGGGSLSQTPTGTTTVAGDKTNVAAFGKTTAANAPAMTPDGLPGIQGQANIAGSPTSVNLPPPSSVTPVTAAPASQSLFDKTVSGATDLGKSAWDATKGAGSAVMDFTKEYPYGAMMIGQTAQPVADYLSGKTDAEIAALEAQTGYADANALRIQEEIAREKRRRENLNAGYAQVDTGINVNPAVIGQAQAGGLISGAMQPAA
jgi:hypothetical protein